MRQLTCASIVAFLAGGVTMASSAATVPPDSEYVRTNADGHLMLKGERQRYWGVIGGFPHAPKGRSRRDITNAYADVDALVQRFTDLGFNLNRMWHGFDDDRYVKGDGSKADIVDYYISVMKKRGLRIWCAGINRLGAATPDDVDIVNDPATARAWRDAVREMKNGRVDLSKRCIQIKWDRRLEAVAIRNRARRARHVNKHTGLRWCDDPVFVAWELSNEEWWISKMVGGQWLKLPEYWRESLVGEWDSFLRKKYRNDYALRRAWKSLLPGESLRDGTVGLLPIKGATDVSRFAMDEEGKKQMMAAQAASDGKFSRDDFARQRGADVVEFFVHLHVSSKEREAEAFKKLGKSTRLCPLAWDTGIGYEIQAQYLHQHADACVHDAYVNGWGWNVEFKDSYDCAQCQRLDLIGAEAVSANKGPWNCWILKPPGIAQGVPWLEHNKVEGKPFFAYETQIQQPAKYRAAFPFRLGMLASIQDWDIACWHYYAPPRGLSTNPRPFDHTMDVTVGGHPQGYHYTFDEIQTAMMRAIGMVWRNESLKPAQNPTKFVFGSRSLYDPDSMDYGHSYGRRGMDMLYTVYQYGVRIEIDPSRAEDRVIGPVVSFDDRHTHNPYTPTDEITYDWKKGHIAFDAPAGVGFVGFMPAVGGRYIFKSGVSISGININNPPGIYDPIGNDEGYIGFALYSEDGAPLRTCRKAALSVVSTSFNSGFSLCRKDFERTGALSHPLAARAPNRRARGKLPVLVARVGADVNCRAIDHMRYAMYDWHMKEIGSGVVRNAKITIPNDKPIFVIRFER